MFGSNIPTCKPACFASHLVGIQTIGQVSAAGGRTSSPRWPPAVHTRTQAHTNTQGTHAVSPLASGPEAPDTTRALRVCAIVKHFDLSSRVRWEHWQRKQPSECTCCIPRPAAPHAIISNLQQQDTDDGARQGADISVVPICVTVVHTQGFFLGGGGGVAGWGKWISRFENSLTLRQLWVDSQ